MQIKGSVFTILILSMTGCWFQKIQTPIVNSNPVGASNPQTKRSQSEILSEVMRVTFDETEVSDQEVYVSLLHSFEQGASIEGIYRGLVASSKYRVKEGQGQAASPTALKFFAELMIDVQKGMKLPTQFEGESAKRLPEINYPDGEARAPEESKREVLITKEEMIRVFLGASLFTLKRVLADEVLKRVDEFSNQPAEFSQWYASFVLKTNLAGVSFDLKDRHNENLDFHIRFAKSNSLDRIKWELLNRIHRILNKKQ